MLNHLSYSDSTKWESESELLNPEDNGTLELLYCLEVWLYQAESWTIWATDSTKITLSWVVPESTKINSMLDKDNGIWTKIKGILNFIRLNVIFALIDYNLEVDKSRIDFSNKVIKIGISIPSN